MTDIETGIQTTYTFGKDETKDTIPVANTYKIQRASVALFAASLGYSYDLFNELDGGSFYNEEGGGNHKMNLVSFTKMQEWHNKSFMPSFHRCIEKELPKVAKALDIPLERLHNAVESKLVKQTFFQVIDKKRLTLTKHIVTFA